MARGISLESTLYARISVILAMRDTASLTSRSAVSAKSAAIGLKSRGSRCVYDKQSETIAELEDVCQYEVALKDSR
jgi:hypothetical protein